MNIIKTEGIIIKTVDFSETSKIITLFSKNQGKISALAKGAYRKKSSFLGRLDLFFQGIFIYSVNRNQELNTLIECDISNSFPNLHTDILKFTYGNYILELLNIIIPTEEEAEKIFNLSLNALKYISLEQLEKIELLIRFFEIKLLCILGFLPSFDCCTNCHTKGIREYILDIERSIILCQKCASAISHNSNHKKNFSNKDTTLRFSPIIKISIDINKIISSAIKKSFKNLLCVKLSESQKKELKDILRIFLDFHLEKQLKSLTLLNKIRKPVNE
jgi:DNA repair protein RecO (recombination protein O)